jgi:amylosucrase
MNTIQRQADTSRERLTPRLETMFHARGASDLWPPFRARLQAHFDALFRALVQLYGRQYDFFYHLEACLATAADGWITRPSDLRALDEVRDTDRDWFQSQRMLGGVCYVDLFGGDLDGVRSRIPYFCDLGLTYLHLMPLFSSPEGNNDGGYAVSDYRSVAPHLGTMDQLADLARELRTHGISLVLDFILNHTSDEHEWARRALAGDPHYQDFYFMFPDRATPDAYSPHLREISPDVRPGSFTYRSDVDRWVWTTFNNFQWDLNYGNPEVFTRMAAEMLFLANHGAEVLRFDALAFVWKQMGTSGENLREAHLVIQAFNAMARLAAPSLLFKSEAIVHPDYVKTYIAKEECQLSYNPLLMALLWEALATRDVQLLRRSMQERFDIDARCAWVNYVRSHDDIGWTFDDGDAMALSIDPSGHRYFLNSFYTGRFDGSFARGLPISENPSTGDARISGTAASLAGLEAAIERDDPDEIELSIRRIVLLYGVVLSIGGVPLIYLGDETGTLNDYSFRLDLSKRDDSRWVHRTATDWTRAERRHVKETVEGRVYGELQRLIVIRKECTAFSGHATQIVDVGTRRVFGYVRTGGRDRVLCLCNFTERDQRIAGNELRLYGLSSTFRDLITNDDITTEVDLVLSPYRVVWLQPQ